MGRKKGFFEYMNVAGKRKKVTLVVGTTPDYIEWIRLIEPGRNIFLTDSTVRCEAREPAPDAEEEILCNLADYRETRERLERYTASRGLVPDGIACFDCESMDLAAALAAQFSLRYPSRESIGLCRSKYLCKLRWREAALDCPETRIIHAPDDGERFFAGHCDPIVLKPLAGSGSEYVYLCRSSEESRLACETILSALEKRISSRMYGASDPAQGLVVAEKFVDGEEYSCDFIINDGEVQPLRLTKKLRGQGMPFGTIHGYVLCNSLPEGIGENVFLETLRRSALILQIDYAICMLDFIVTNNRMILLEIAPRPGGDCLPRLLKGARGLDILKLTLDFARQERMPPAVIFDNGTAGFAGMKIIAERSGTLRRIDAGALRKDGRIVETCITKEPGHIIVMPPEDYDSRILGHIIFRLEEGRDPFEQLMDINGKIAVEMDD